MGKGTMTLSPYHSDRNVFSPVTMAGLLSVLILSLDMKSSAFLLTGFPVLCTHSRFIISSAILGRFHYYLYTLGVSMNPRHLQLLDDSLQPIHTSVRVGQVLW
jgi:26S proteasome regulatory subunit N1